MVKQHIPLQTEYVDCHVHTKASHDSVAEPRDIVNSALDFGLKGFLISDHVDTGVTGTSFLDPAIQSFKNYCEEFPRYLNESEHPLGFEMLFGVEIGESIRNPEACEKLINMLPFDAVLGSVHKIYIDGRDFCFSDHKFSELPAAFVRRVVVQYYKDVLETAKNSDINILSHLNLINRYEWAPGKQDILDEELSPVINEILDTIIRRGIALEVNTFVADKGMLMPGDVVLNKYKEKGGKLITLGSDSHCAANLGKEFPAMKKSLKAAGFDQAVYFKKRKPVFYDLL